VRRGCVVAVLFIASACADPPSADVTHQAAEHAVFARQHEDCLRLLRTIREQRARDHATLEHASAALDAARSAGSGVEAAQALVDTASASWQGDRSTLRAREAECDAIEARIHEAR